MQFQKKISHDRRDYWPVGKIKTLLCTQSIAKFKLVGDNLCLQEVKLEKTTERL